jgi:EmrB/QacA subfamily drug resistance transporter
MLVAAVFMGAFIVMIDVSIVIVALPTLQSSLHSDIAGLQWIVDAYSLCLSAFLLTAGALGDRHGRRKLWLIGIVVFVSGSVFCAASRTYEAFVAARIVQGVGGALLIPGPLSIIFQAFRDPRQRGHVIAAWASFNGLSLIVRLVLGGVLISRFGWPSIFLINVPIGIVAISLGLVSIPESSDPSHTSLDLPGQILSILGLGGLIYALIRGGHDGWLAPSTIEIFLAAVLALMLFVGVEHRSKRPMLSLALFGNPTFSAAIAASFVIGFSAFSSSFFLSLFFQRIQGLSPDEAGWRLAPQFLSVAIVSTASGFLAHRFGGWRLMTVGFALIGLGLGGLSTIVSSTTFDHIVPWLVLLGIGMGLALPTTNSTGISVTPR